MIRRPPRSTRTDTLFPYTTLFRSDPYAFLTPLPPLSPLAIITENWIARAAERDQWPILAIIAEQNLLPRLFHSLIAQLYRVELTEEVRPDFPNHSPRYRSEQRRVGKGFVSTFKSGWAPYQ